MNAQGARTSAAIERAHGPDSLQPGQWVWTPDVSPAGPVVVFVDLSRQLASVYRNAVRIGVTTISSGRRRYETPAGVFTILRKTERYRSRRYDNASMPFAVWLTDDGVALHAGGLPGYPASHGCVRLPYHFAQQVFQIVSIGGVVVMTGAAGAADSGDGAGLLAPINASGDQTNYQPLDGADFRWRPHASRSGPTTIILSRASQQLVALRNGVEIGRANVSIPTDERATRVLTMSRDELGGPLWRAIGEPGGASPLEAAIVGVSIPAPFLVALLAELEPGATILVTPAPIDGAARSPLHTATEPSQTTPSFF